EEAIYKGIPRTVNNVTISLRPIQIEADAVSDCGDGNALDMRRIQPISRDNGTASHRIAYVSCEWPRSEDLSAHHLPDSQRRRHDGAAVRTPSNIGVGELAVDQGDVRAVIDLYPP